MRGAWMERVLLEAAVSGNTQPLDGLRGQDVLLGTTPEQRNTCLHIAATHGHEKFCSSVLERLTNPSALLTAVNSDGETPLLTAVINGHSSLASSLLNRYRNPELTEALLKIDKHRCNALHHAIRGGHKELAMQLIEAEPGFTSAVNDCNESPMFIAVMKGYEDMAEQLLDVSDSSHSGAVGYNALHAAIKYNRINTVQKIMDTRPELATEEDKQKTTPMQLAVHWDKPKILQIMIEKDWTLGYQVSSTGYPLLCTAAKRGHVAVAEELLKHCPDAPYFNNDAWTCLHEAVEHGHMHFVEFILRNQELRKLVNLRNKKDETALHLAVKKCDPDMVTALLDKDIDVTMIDTDGNAAIWKLLEVDEYAKTLNWNKISKLISKADSGAETDIYNLHKEAKVKALSESRKSVKSLTKTYTSNTSLVAILVATITFAAAFTLPGGYSNDAGSEGLPVMARKYAFQAFLVADTLAMCSSLAVAFICIILRWEDFEYLLYYRHLTQILMWFAYVATTIAFATGLYTVMAPRVQWLAILVCVFSVLFPIFTWLLGKFPILQIKYRSGGIYNSNPHDTNLLDMV